MTEPVKPIGKNTPAAPAAPAKTEAEKEKSNKIKIGGVIFDKNQIEADKTTSYTENGKKMNTVFVKPGVRIDFPDQKNTDKNPSVESRGLYDKWYNPDDSYITITDIEDAKIYGNPNKSDFIDLEGKSRNNEVFVDKKESWYINGDMRKDYVTLYGTTENNTVHMDEKDKTDIWYNQSGVVVNGETYKDETDVIQVEGKGESAQEEQLKGYLGDNKYDEHKFRQER